VLREFRGRQTPLVAPAAQLLSQLAKHRQGNTVGSSPALAAADCS
jgi:hypothetical protein